MVSPVEGKGLQRFKAAFTERARRMYSRLRRTGEAVVNPGIDAYANRAREDFPDKAPEIYRNANFMEGILSATRLQEGDTGRTIADLLSGTGSVGKEIEKRYPGNTVWFVDSSVAQLSIIPDQEHVIQHDMRNGLPDNLPPLDGIVIRFGVKNLLREAQQRLIKDVAERLRDGGWLVIADMVAPDGMQEWQNKERWMKHKAEGQDVEREGAGNIPTHREWRVLMENAGLTIEMDDPYVSHVTTQSWKDSGQFAGDEVTQNESLRTINSFLLNAPANVREAYNIHSEGDLVKLDYPLRVFRAVKHTSIRRR